VFTGLQPGEKLRQKLFSPGQEGMVTKHRKAYLARDRPTDSLDLEEHLEELKRLMQAGDDMWLKRKFRGIVPEYQPYETTDYRKAQAGCSPEIYKPTGTFWRFYLISPV